MTTVVLRLKSISQSRLGLFLRIFVSLGLLAVVVSRINVQEATQYLVDVKWIWLGGAFLCYILGELISGLRWQILIRSQGSDVPLSALLRALVMGRFFNQFMLSTIGGDTARFWESSRLTGKPLGAGVVLVADRLIGLIALFVIAAVAAVVGTSLIPELQAWRWLALAGAVSGVTVLYMSSMPQVFSRFQKYFPQRLQNLADVLNKLQQEPKGLRNAFILSLLLQINVLFQYLTLARAVGIELPFIVFALIVPIALLVLAIPITINGLGLREVTFIGLLGIWGVSAQQGAAYAWLDLGFGLTKAIVGGLFFMIRR